MLVLARHFAAVVGMPFLVPSKIFCDNSLTVDMIMGRAEPGKLHYFAKHVEVVKQLVIAGEVTLEHLP